MRMINLCPALAGALLMLSAAQAAAESPVGERPLGTFDNRLSLSVRGHIKPRCQLGAGSAVRLGELVGIRTRGADLDLDCNVPFDITVSSPNGGLVHETLPGGQGPYAGTLLYSVDFTVPTVTPDVVIVKALFDSAEMKQVRTISSGSGISNGSARLEFRTSAPSGDGLLAGRYSDTVNLTITPRLF